VAATCWLQQHHDGSPDINKKQDLP